jgi:hypothetical protein
MEVCEDVAVTEVQLGKDKKFVACDDVAGTELLVDTHTRVLLTC